MLFEFATSARIVFGPGTLSEAGKNAASLGKHALVVTGKDPRRRSQLTQHLAAAGISYTFFSVEHEPSTSDVENGVEAAREDRCDLVISIGGGSVIDTGKAIAALLANPGTLLDYLEVIGGGKSLPNRSFPFIAIPTTSGTGSEVTRNAVLFSPEHRVKVSLRSAGMLPTIALVDPDLALGLPPSLTASTGMDAVAQVLEPYVSSRASPLSDPFCREGLRLAAGALRDAYHNGSDRNARRDMSLASLFGGLALANAGLGAVHGFAGPLGGMFEAPHGALCAALLPRVMEANIRALRARDATSASLTRYEEVARILTNRPNAAAEEGVTWVHELITNLQVPSLSAYGFTQAHIETAIQKARRASSMKANPIELTGPELEWVLEQAL